MKRTQQYHNLNEIRVVSFYDQVSSFKEAQNNIKVAKDGFSKVVQSVQHRDPVWSSSAAAQQVLKDGKVIMDDYKKQKKIGDDAVKGLDA